MQKERLKKQLLDDEGLRMKPYHCTGGKLTIGIGRNLEDVGISKEEAEYLLENDINRIHRDLSKKIDFFADLDSLRQEVLINMAFNMGVSGLLGFRRTLAFMRKGDFDAASVEMLKSKWSQQVPNRAFRLSLLMKETTGRP